MENAFPAERALALVNEAEDFFLTNQEEHAYVLLMQVIQLQREVERYSGSEWQANHQTFTEVLIRAFPLAWQLGGRVLAKQLYERALAWADDPNCSNQRQYDEIIHTWERLNRKWWQSLFAGIKGLAAIVGEYEIRKGDVE